ncbi:hypothetical protein D3C72_1856450 [compost metagenome]
MQVKLRKLVRVLLLNKFFTVGRLVRSVLINRLESFAQMLAIAACFAYQAIDLVVFEHIIDQGRAVLGRQDNNLNVWLYNLDSFDQ